MPVDLQHVIVPATDPRGSARFLADILGLPVWPAAGACFSSTTSTSCESNQEARPRRALRGVVGGGCHPTPMAAAL
jgi:hypothetical protein